MNRDPSAPTLEQHAWNLSVDPRAVEAVRQVRHQLKPLYVPSGIPGLDLSAGSHVAVVALDRTNSYFGSVLDFVAAGIADHPREIVSLELAADTRETDAQEALARRVGRPVNEADVDIREWAENASDYEPELFTVAGMHAAMAKERARLDASARRGFRCASADCSHFLRWLRNPADYVAYEPTLMVDLQRILNVPSLQLCAFRLSNLELLEQEHGLKAGDVLADVVLSHTHLVAVDGPRVMTGRAALAAVSRYADALGVSWRRRLKLAARALSPAA